jgi:hypothetical protein
MSANSVDSDQYVDGSIDTAHIGDGQITSAKLDTNIAVAGTLTLGSHLIMGDNDRIKIGSGTDLEIYHDGSDTFIDDSTGTGNLYVLSNQFLVNNANGTQNMGRFADGGAVTLYYAGAAKLATTSSGIDVTGTVVADGLTVDTSTLVVDATNNRVGIGLTNPANSLEIQHGTIGTGNGSNNTLALRYNSTTLYGQHYMDANGLYHIRADGQGVAGGNLILGGDTSVQIWTGSTPESRVTVDSSGNLDIASRIRHIGDTDTYLSFANADDFRIVVGNSTRAAFNTSKIHFNQEGINQDFQVEGQGTGNEGLLYVDASANKVGIATSSPSSTLTVSGTIESLKDDTYGSNEGGQLMLRAPSASTTTAKRYSLDTFNVSGNSTFRLISEDDSNGANGVVRMALDTKGTFFFTNDLSSYGHNTYAHAAVFSRNSTPAGTVVIEDSDVSSGIGNTVLRCFLRDQDPATTAIFIDFADGGGRVGSVSHNDDGGGVSYNTTSDYRLKENVNYDWDALSLVNQLKPAKFNFLSNPAKTVQGFLAHEVSDIVPSSVRGNKDHIESIGTVTDSDGNVVYEGVYEHFCKTDEGQTWTKTGEEPIYQQLDYSRIVPLLTKAVQEQQTQIETLKAEIQELKG